MDTHVLKFKFKKKLIWITKPISYSFKNKTTFLLFNFHITLKSLEFWEIPKNLNSFLKGSHIHFQQYINKKHSALPGLELFSRIFDSEKKKKEKKKTSIVKKEKGKKSLSTQVILPKYSFNSPAISIDGPIRALHNTQKSLWYTPDRKFCPMMCYNKSWNPHNSNITQ